MKIRGPKTHARDDAWSVTWKGTRGPEEKPAVWLREMGGEGGGAIRPGKHHVESRTAKERFLTPLSLYAAIASAVFLSGVKSYLER